MALAKTILKAALLVGTLDITAAFIQVYLRTGEEPFRRVLSFVGRGLLGKNTTVSTGGQMLTGLLVHYFIAAAFTVFFFLTVARWQASKRHPLATGILYGLFVWAVMNLAVLPLLNIRPLPDLSKDPGNSAVAAGILIVCIGIPLAFIGARQRTRRLAFG